jgi:hypothetical protein
MNGPARFGDVRLEQTVDGVPPAHDLAPIHGLML